MVFIWLYLVLDNRIKKDLWHWQLQVVALILVDIHQWDIFLHGQLAQNDYLLCLWTQCRPLSAYRVLTPQRGLSAARSICMWKWHLHGGDAGTCSHGATLSKRLNIWGSANSNDDSNNKCQHLASDDSVFPTAISRTVKPLSSASREQSHSVSRRETLSKWLLWLWLEHEAHKFIMQQSMSKLFIVMINLQKENINNWLYYVTGFTAITSTSHNMYISFWSAL